MGSEIMAVAFWKFIVVGVSCSFVGYWLWCIFTGQVVGK